MNEYEKLKESLSADKALDAATAEALLEKYPFLSIAASRALLNPDLTPEQKARFQAAVALNAPDTDTLVRLIDRDGAEFAGFYPEDDREETPTTENAIDTFLDTYGHGIDPKEEALLERLIFNPVPADYSELLVEEATDAGAQETPAYEKSEQDTLLDAFLDSQGVGPASRKEEHEESVAPPKSHYHAKPDPEAPLSESLAKIFIKRGRYDKAYEIIKQLSLNFPEKSVYFADQLRFLRKLMINQKYDKTKK